VVCELQCKVLIINRLFYPKPNESMCKCKSVAKRTCLAKPNKLIPLIMTIYVYYLHINTIVSFNTDGKKIISQKSKTNLFLLRSLLLHVRSSNSACSKHI
jgi:hypothetical protein